MCVCVCTCMCVCMCMGVCVCILVSLCRWMLCALVGGCLGLCAMHMHLWVDDGWVHTECVCLCVCAYDTFATHTHWIHFKVITVHYSFSLTAKNVILAGVKVRYGVVTKCKNAHETSLPPPHTHTHSLWPFTTPPPQLSWTSPLSSFSDQRSVATHTMLVVSQKK